MAKPYVHALSSARRWGGAPEDYLPIHDLLDSSKAVFPDNRHRALTHTAWFIAEAGPVEQHSHTHVFDAEAQAVVRAWIDAVLAVSMHFGARRFALAFPEGVQHPPPAYRL